MVGIRICCVAGDDSFGGVVYSLEFVCLCLRLLIVITYSSFGRIRDLYVKVRVCLFFPMWSIWVLLVVLMIFDFV